MKAHIDVRAVLLLSVLLPFLVLYSLVNTLLFLLNDALGTSRLRARLVMRKKYSWTASSGRVKPRGEELARLMAKARQVGLDLARQGWVGAPDGESEGPDRIDQARLVLGPHSLGMRLPHSAAKDHASGIPKRVYWLEGSHFEMGWLLGMLAEPDIQKMTRDYVDNVIFDFAGDSGKHPILGTFIADLIYRLASLAKARLPGELEAEIYGIYAGCLARNPKTKVVIRDLLVLNYGVDVVLSLVYSGAEVVLRILGITLSDWKAPAACNGFAVLGKAAGGGAFFGRDFMFPTCGVFGSCAAPIIMKSNGLLCPPDRKGRERKVHSPLGGEEKPRLVTSFTAPGMVGSVAILNDEGLAMGIDMVNGRNSRFYPLGLNSLMMIRYATHWTTDAHQTVRLMRRTPRGVSTLYLLAHGPGQHGAVIEAGYSGQDQNYLRRVPASLKPWLPDYRFIKAHPGTHFEKGMGVRWNGWTMPEGWLDFNPGLWKAVGFTWPQQGWGERETLCPRGPWKSQVPSAFWFPPQRESRKDLVLGCNHYLIPELRLLGMNEWTARIAEQSGEYDDFQWRYDTLNRWLLESLDSGTFDLDACQDAASFLRPCNADHSPAPNHFYYATDKKTGDEIPLEKIPVGGMTAAMDLMGLRMRFLYGWYVDPWVELDMEKNWARD